MVSSRRKGSNISRLMEPFIVRSLIYAVWRPSSWNFLQRAWFEWKERLRNAPRTTLSKSAVPAPGGFPLNGGSQFSSLWEPNFSRIVVFDSNGKALRMLNHWRRTVVGLASEATVPVCDRIPPPFNTIQVAAAVEQFLLASLKCSFDDFKGHRLVGPRWLALP